MNFMANMLLQEPADAVQAAVDAVNADLGILWIIIAAILVFFMQAGFTLVETGFTSAKNAGNIIMKNFMDLAVGSLMFWVVGYSIMYGGETILGGFMRDPSDLAFFSEDDWHNLFFQTVFCATAATIVSGAVAGRFKFSSYLIISAVLTTFIYPVSGSWLWPFDDQAWLNNLGFIDFAGSTIVHAVGGFAALVAAKLVGPRIGKYGPDGKVNAIPGHNLVLGALGVFILWLGWFGFNGGSQLAFGGDDSIAVGSVIINTNLAAALGGIAALFFTWIKYGKPDISMTLNGALAGLVGITAGCGNVDAFGSVAIGLISGIVVVLSIEFIDKKLKIDDPVGAISVHGVCGFLGTVLVGVFATEGGVLYGGGFGQLGVQFLGSISMIAWAIVATFIVLFIVKKTIGIRVSEKEELEGLDAHEHGTTAYNFEVDE
ncbi:MAG: ammonium transporter [Bacteroidota bacterium]|uniref:Ammonium transporter n=2 Tax=Flavobacteriaceae TaxID=49546 RepID=A0A1M5SH04_9FLAO|nr:MULTISPECIES: ammonium transporter [Leeuwenhoekiella]MEC7783292.1 ammonium transporter [Bacteroidota bacterium]MEC8682382.1 ammonium transporter [Bacteroidota bacterium]MEE3244084.1 ammonium transporter [Bacteroidota bacterium]RXG28968.1 ammonium transporter [Leeuwenhoekiella palythoae]SHH37690.1 ammonium transporter [Leeuwenhoekiella palythoae]